MVLYPNKLPESERVCSGICSRGFQKDYEKVNFQRIAKDKEGMQKDA